MKIILRYVVAENRTNDYYEVGQLWILSNKKRSRYKIVWNKWFFNRRIVIFILKRI